MEHAWLLGNSRTRQNAIVSSVIVYFKLNNENTYSIYIADDMHIDKGIELVS